MNSIRANYTDRDGKKKLRGYSAVKYFNKLQKLKNYSHMKYWLHLGPWLKEGYLGSYLGLQMNFLTVPSGISTSLQPIFNVLANW